MEIDLGTDFVVQCKTRGITEEATPFIDWYRRHRDGSLHPLPIARVRIEKQVDRDYSVVDILKLGFEDFDVSDAGEYVCKGRLGSTVTSNSIVIKGEMESRATEIRIEHRNESRMMQRQMHSLGDTQRDTPHRTTDVMVCQCTTRSPLEMSNEIF